MSGNLERRLERLEASVGAGQDKAEAQPCPACANMEPRLSPSVEEFNAMSDTEQTALLHEIANGNGRLPQPSCPECGRVADPTNAAIQRDLDRIRPGWKVADFYKLTREEYERFMRDLDALDRPVTPQRRGHQP
jgi:hypothetical protein